MIGVLTSANCKSRAVSCDVTAFFVVTTDQRLRIKLFKPEEATIAYIRGHRYHADPSQCAALAAACKGTPGAAVICPPVAETKR